MRKSFKIIIHRKAAKELNGLTANMRNRVIEVLREMEANPHLTTCLIVLDHEIE